jgi:hypothetical protein
MFPSFPKCHDEVDSPMKSQFQNNPIDVACMALVQNPTSENNPFENGCHVIIMVI